MTAIEVYGGTSELESLIASADSRGEFWRAVYDDFDERIILWVTIGDDVYENMIAADERDDAYWSEDVLAEAESYWRQ